MKKAKKRSNSFSKFQKEILFVLVLIAVSLIGFTILAVATGKNPFQFLFSQKLGKKGIYSGLKDEMRKDEYIDGEDKTIEYNLNKNLIAWRGASNEPNESQNTAYTSQFLHKLFLKDKEKINSLVENIKKQANIDVGLKFFLVPNELLYKDPKDFGEERKKCLDVTDLQYTKEGDIEAKDYFGSFVVFNNEIWDGTNKKYEYEWFNYQKEKSKKLAVSAFRNTENNQTKYYLPNDNVFTEEEINNFVWHKEFSNVNKCKSISHPTTNTQVLTKDYVKTTEKIPTPNEIENYLKNQNNEKKFSIYNPYGQKFNENQEKNYPKLIFKKNVNNYISTDPFILINYWNEMILDNNFFDSEEIQNEYTKTGLKKDDFLNDEGQPTLFVEVTYTLVDDEGKAHSFFTESSGPNLQSMNLGKSNVSGGGGSNAGRRLTVTRKDKQTITNAQERTQ